MKIITSSLLGKLLAITGSGTALLIAAIAYALIQSNNTITQYQTLLDDSVASERAILRMEAQFKIQVQEWKNTLIRGADPKSFDKYWGNFQKEEARVQQDGEALLKQIGNPKAKALLQQFLAAHKSMGEAYRRGVEEYKASGFVTQQGDKAVKGIDREPTTLLDQAAAELAQSVQQLSTKTDEDAQAAMREGITLMMLAIVVTFVALLWSIRRMVLQPMDRMVQQLSRLADGNFTEVITNGSHDEIGRLAKSAEKIRQELGMALHQVVESAATLATESTQLASISTATTEGVATQQRETDMVATAINEMTATVGEVPIWMITSSSKSSRSRYSLCFSGKSGAPVSR